MLIEIPKPLETTLIALAKQHSVTAESLAIQAIQNTYLPQSQDVPFNYDLERMQSMMTGLETPADIAKNTISVPKGKTAEELLEWFDNLSEKDFIAQSLV